ncbi:MAG TPA: hypothetical protein VG708_00635 [Mycobacteriales bacterium]|nr:hypothetical protein [Mycobacteriales bacterium]
MSETSLLPPFGQPAVAPPGGAAAAPEEPEHQPGNHRRFLLIAAVVVAVVVLATVGYLLLHHGSTPASQPVPSAVPTHQPQSSGPAAQHAVQPTAPRLHKHAAATARNPFQPLVLPPQTSSGTTTAGSTTTTGTTGTTTTGTPPVTGTVPSVTRSPISGPPKWVQLLGVSGSKSATFDLGYSRHRIRWATVKPPAAGATKGTVFGKVLSLVAIHHGSVVLQVGDAAPFTLTTGVAHVV